MIIVARSSSTLRAMKLLVLCLLLACGGNPTTTPKLVERVLVNVDEHGVALQDQDPMSYWTTHANVTGSARYTSVWGGATYWFVSDEHRKAFDGSPEHHAPRYGGYCAYAASQNRLSPITTDQFEIYEDHLLLFTNADYKQRFDAARAEAFAKAEANWPLLLAAHGKSAR